MTNVYVLLSKYGNSGSIMGIFKNLKTARKHLELEIRRLTIAFEYVFEEQSKDYFVSDIENKEEKRIVELVKYKIDKYYINKKEWDWKVKTK